MKIVTVNMEEEHLIKMEKLIGENKMYPSRSELVRVAVRKFLLKELELLKNKNKNHKKKIKIEKMKQDKNIVIIPYETNDEIEYKEYKIVKKLESIKNNKDDNKKNLIKKKNEKGIMGNPFWPERDVIYAINKIKEAWKRNV